MKFYVINKEHGTSYSVEASDIKDAVTKVTGEVSPFMIVSREYVEDGETYQAIQVKPDTVQINFKKGHKFVTASTIAEALEVDVSTTVETKINTVTVYNGDTIVDTKEFDVTNGDVVIDDWLDSLTVQPEEGYEFVGFAFSKSANKAANRPIKALENKESTSIYAIFKPVDETETE